MRQIRCSECYKPCKSRQGLSIHWTKAKHPSDVPLSKVKGAPVHKT